MPAQLVLRSKENLADYFVLRNKVQEIFLQGQKRIEKEFVRIRWETGRVVNEHLRLNADSAKAGENSILNLSKDLGIDASELRRFAQFAKALPQRGSCRTLRLNLSWSHYRKLITIPDDKQRFEMTARAERENWLLEHLEDRLRHEIRKGKNEKAERLPFVCLGPFYTYKIIRPESIGSKSKELLIDLGFSHRLEIGLFLSGHDAKIPANTIVTSVKNPKGKYSFTKVQPADEGILYTFQAYVERVVDGDTLKLEFQLGLGSWHAETIRLNGIDCPELDTSEGKAAKRFVESELSGAGFITVKSIRTRKEKWGRFLGDVFYSRKGSGLTYLNQLLLDKGHAVRLRM